MARAGAGEPFIITEATEAAGVGERFRRYVEAPVLSQIQLQGQGVELYDMEPAQIPVMLAERPIVVFGKYRDARPGAALVLRGITADGAYRSSLPLAGEAQPNNGELLPILWARQRVERLSEAQGADTEGGPTREKIVELGLRHSLLTPYTAFVAVDETVVNPNGQADDVNQALPLPLGVSELAVARPVPEPELVWLLLLLAGWFGGERLLRQRRVSSR
jgi:Ca-activated chloride channel family protein